MGGPTERDAVAKTVAGFANSFYGGTLLVGVTDGGGVYGLEDDDATVSKRGERGDRDLWGQHLKNLLDRLGKSAAALVDWDFFTIDGKDICRISIDPSDPPSTNTGVTSGSSGGGLPSQPIASTTSASGSR